VQIIVSRYVLEGGKYWSLLLVKKLKERA
jgi:hypothetical protein